MNRVVLVIMFMLFVHLSIHAQEKTWERRAELSYVQTTGNSRSETASFKLDVNGKGEKNRAFMRLLYLLMRDEGQQKANKFSSGIRYERVFTGRLFGFIDTGYLRDRFAGFEHRVSAGPGIGYDMMTGEKQVLKSLVSGMYVYEKYAVNDHNSDRFATLKMALNYGWNIKENVSFKTNGNYSVSLKDHEKYYINVESSLSVGINSRFSIGISYLVNYQNLVPAPHIRSTDTSFLTSLIVNL
jgi:putative salt-induced outer membrane protein